ncbi:MAG TPA: Holliday junction branch migration protein RuvA [Oligoflexia bacterium]|nr:Holliday junction branch migration protein RuvA [Oligoflexia bacterium]HMP49672.1 Holliday junction branch migration protein RuvA [Oligoflexia bacterium]
MIALLNGELVVKQQDTLVIDVNGVGYEVFTNSRISSALPGVGNKISLIIYTDVRDTAITLYGFNTQVERQTFLLLKKVKGIGSKLAMGILSSVNPEELLLAIGTENTDVLRGVPGVGKKSAERIIVELREQVREFTLGLQLEVSSVDKVSLDRKVNRTLTEQKDGKLDHHLDAVLALEKLGFSADRAEKAVRKAIEANAKPGKLDAGDLVKLSLSYF